MSDPHLFERGATYRATRAFVAERDRFDAGEELVYASFGESVYDGMQGFFFLEPAGDRHRSWDMGLGTTPTDVPFEKIGEVAELIRAAGAGDAERTTALLDAAGDRPDQGAVRRLALEDAVRAGRAAVVAVMVARPAFAALRERALLDAASAGQPDIVSALLAAGLDPNLADPMHQTPLRFAVFGGHASVVARLLAAGADPDRDPWKRAGMVDLARRRGFTGIVALLEARDG